MIPGFPWIASYKAIEGNRRYSMKTIYTIPEQSMGKLEIKLEKINKKAVKLGFPLVSMTTIREVFKSKIDPFTEIRHEWKAIEVEISGETPRIAGCAFVAALDHLVDDEGKPITILRVVPGMDLPERFRTIGPICEHCHQIRKRVKTYVLQDESLTYKIVGSTCLSDFTGAGFDPESAAAYCEMVLDLCDEAREESERSGGPRTEAWINLDKFLAVTAALIRIDGWLSKSQAMTHGVQSTANICGTMFFDRREDPDIRKFCTEREPTQEDIDMALATREWIRNLGTEKAVSDYEYNLKTVEGLGRVNDRLFGIAASAVAGYRRWVGKEVERKHAAETSNHFGEVGKREVFTLTVSTIFETENQWGVTRIVKFLSEEGNRAVWFSSKDPKVEIGGTYKVKATVKKHDEYQGVKQTTLTRCKILD
jgi:hypothetical protein